jgi:hypothetical protein
MRKVGKRKNQTKRGAKMTKFCAYHVGDGIWSGYSQVYSEEVLREQFGQGDCGWFVNRLNQLADRHDYGDFCFVSVGFKDVSNVYVVTPTCSASSTIDIFDDERKAGQMVKVLSKCYSDWKEKW